MVDVGLVTRQHEEASQEVGLNFRVSLHAHAMHSAVTNRATFCEAFFMASEHDQYRVLPINHAPRKRRVGKSIFDRLRDLWAKGDAIDHAAFRLWIQSQPEEEI